MIDEHGQVVDFHGRPIPGLYATGNVVANVFGFSYPGPGATIADLRAEGLLPATGDVTLHLPGGVKPVRVTAAYTSRVLARAQKQASRTHHHKAKRRKKTR